MYSSYAGSGCYLHGSFDMNSYSQASFDMGLYLNG